VILVYVVNLGRKTSNFIEVAVSFHKLQIANNRGISKLSIKGDSRNTIMMLNGKVSPCWSLWDLITKAFLEIINIGNCQIKNMFHEGNMVVDGMMNMREFVGEIMFEHAKYLNYDN
jgi:hypothetical protein